MEGMHPGEILEREVLAAAKLDQNYSDEPSVIEPTLQEPMEHTNTPEAENADVSDAETTSAANTQNTSNVLSNVPETFVRWPSPFHIKDVLDEMVATITKYVLLPKEDKDALALWIAASYLMNAFNIFPKLALISPTFRCGKTTTMSVLASMSKDGLPVSNFSPATLFRLTAQAQLTLFIDEADRLIKSGPQDLIGLINGSHSKSSSGVLRCVGDNHEARVFNTWMPIVMASIGVLDDTIMDRSIVINLRRMKPTERALVKRVPADLFNQLSDVRRKLFTWSCDSQVFEKFSSNPVEPPDLGNDRAADNWLPLFCVAQEAGGHWPERCQKAYEALTDTSGPAAEVQLLSAIQELFLTSDSDRISTEKLLNHLREDEGGPWDTCNNGGKVTPHWVASTLKPFGISPKAYRWGDSTKRGYEASQFEDVFERYLS